MFCCFGSYPCILLCIFSSITTFSISRFVASRDCPTFLGVRPSLLLEILVNSHLSLNKALLSILQDLKDNLQTFPPKPDDTVSY